MSAREEAIVVQATIVLDLIDELTFLRMAQPDPDEEPDGWLDWDESHTAAVADKERERMRLEQLAHMVVPSHPATARPLVKDLIEGAAR